MKFETGIFYNGKKKIICFQAKRSRKNLVAVSATDNRNYIAPVNETDNVVFLPFNDEAALQQYFDQHGHEVFISDHRRYSGGGRYQCATTRFMQLIRRLCDKHGAVFIADSVQCGYGRTGRFSSHDYADVNADIYSMAKGMGNRISGGRYHNCSTYQTQTFSIRCTFGGNPSGCGSAGCAGSNGRRKPDGQRHKMGKPIWWKNWKNRTSEKHSLAEV